MKILLYFFARYLLAPLFVDDICLDRNKNDQEQT